LGGKARQNLIKGGGRGSQNGFNMGEKELLWVKKGVKKFYREGGGREKTKGWV